VSTREILCTPFCPERTTCTDSVKPEARSLPCRFMTTEGTKKKRRRRKQSTPEPTISQVEKIEKIVERVSMLPGVPLDDRTKSQDMPLNEFVGLEFQPESDNFVGRCSAFIIIFMSYEYIC
jgi:hypothetical protein